jgi:hypothetical protein
VTICDVRQTRYRLGSLSFSHGTYIYAGRKEDEDAFTWTWTLHSTSETWSLITIGPHSCKDEKSARNTGKE